MNISKPLNIFFLFIVLNYFLIAGLVIIFDTAGSSSQISNNNSVKTQTRTQTSTPTTTPITTTSSSDCIIQINSNKYNITALRKTHSGGDIFQCGTDMTQVYYSMHNDNLLRTQMSQYLIK